MVVYLDKYRKAKAISKVPVQCRDAERMCVNSNPAVRAFATSCYQTPDELSPCLPDETATIDTETFLARVYALATQI